LLSAAAAAAAAAAGAKNTVGAKKVAEEKRSKKIKGVGGNKMNRKSVLRTYCDDVSAAFFF